MCKECFAKKAGYETHTMQHINDKVKQSSCEPQVKETNESNRVATVKQTGHLKRKMLANTQKTELLDTNQNVSNKEQKNYSSF